MLHLNFTMEMETSKGSGHVFKATNMGTVEGMKRFMLTGTSNLRRFLIDHLDTVQLAAAAGMPTCDAMVSMEARGA